MNTIEFCQAHYPRAIRASNIEQAKYNVYMGFTEFLRRDGFTTIKFLDYTYTDTGLIMRNSLREDEFILFALKWS